jgi:hypothetical protein
VCRLDRGAGIISLDKDGYTALMAAGKGGHEQCVAINGAMHLHMLLEAGISNVCSFR